MIRATFVLLCACAPAFAQATVVVDDRRSYVYTFTQSETGTDHYSREMIAAQVLSDPYQTWNDSAGVYSPAAGVARASADMQLTSTITSSSFTASATTTSTAEIDDFTGQYASGQGQALILVGFTLGQQSDWRLLGTMSGSGYGFSTLSLVEGLAPFGTAVFSFSSADTTNVDQVFHLEAGDYYLTMSAESITTAFFTDYLTAQTSFDASFTLVPAPGAASLAGLLCVLGARRRRRA